MALLPPVYDKLIKSALNILTLYCTHTHKQRIIGVSRAHNSHQMLPIHSSDIYTMIRAGIVCNIMFHSRFNAAIICYIHFRDLHSMDLTHSIISIQTKWYTILINPMRTCQSNVNDIASKANKISSNLYTTSMAECSSRTKHVFVSLVFFSSRLLNALSNPLWMEVINALTNYCSFFRPFVVGTYFEIDTIDLVKHIASTDLCACHLSKVCVQVDSR